MASSPFTSGHLGSSAETKATKIAANIAISAAYTFIFDVGRDVGRGGVGRGGFGFGDDEG